MQWFEQSGMYVMSQSKQICFLTTFIILRHSSRNIKWWWLNNDQRVRPFNTFKFHGFNLDKLFNGELLYYKLCDDLSYEWRLISDHHVTCRKLSWFLVNNWYFIAVIIKRFCSVRKYQMTRFKCLHSLWVISSLKINNYYLASIFEQNYS